MAERTTDVVGILHASRAPGLNKQKLTEFYDSWARDGKYDSDLPPEEYGGGPVIAAEMKRHLASDARILDVAAGTGKVGEALKAEGFTNLEALDPSPGMLEIAKKKNVYLKYHQEFMGSDPTPGIDQDTYDGLTMMGALLENHLPAVSMHEFIRIVKPGGVFILGIVDAALEGAQDFREQFFLTLERLMQDGKCEKVEDRLYDQHHRENKGRLRVYRVL